MRQLKYLQEKPGWLTPGVAVALGSLVLSVIALIDDPVVNRDGMLYVSVAREVIEQGVTAAFDRFNWPFLPLLLALGSVVSGADPAQVATGYSVLSVLLLCVLAVRIAGRLSPQWSWLAVLFVLGAPVFNEYRADLLRGTGAWLFLLLALDQVLSWVHTRRSRHALGIQIFVVGAFLFRPEMAFLSVSVPLWLLVREGLRQGLIDTLRLTGGLLIGGLAGSALLLTGVVGDGIRVLDFLQVLNLPAHWTGFEDKAREVVETELSHHSSEEAPQILLVGLVSVIFTKWLTLLGIFAMPFLYAVIYRKGFLHRGIFVTAIAFHVLVLVLFLTRDFFISARYAVPLALLSLPWVCIGLSAFSDKFNESRWRGAGYFLVVVSALSGVISTSPGKDHIKQAGQWIRHQEALPEPIYFSDRQIAYYATRSYPEPTDFPPLGRVMAKGGAWNAFAVLIEEEVSGSRVDEWADNKGLTLHRRFSDGADEEVRVYVGP